MVENSFSLKGEERIVQSLRALYLSYGYSTYKMSRFEEYDLYGRNKDFLVSGSIITFTDTDGKLMALKPDVTLSIVKGLREEEGCVSRVCYDEKVYRVSSSSGSFREITQTGLECMGEIGCVELGEVALLAQKSLKSISKDSVLTISHMGIVEAMLDRIPEKNVRNAALGYIETKNISALTVLEEENPSCKEALEKIKALLSLYGTSEEIIDALWALGAEPKCMTELENVVSALDENCVRIDFSVLGGMSYYNGITFRGYIKGVPEAVVSGGQYDKLMARMGKKAKAIGFAVYMDALERILESAEEFDVDVVLLYDEESPLPVVMGKAEEIRREGKSVATMKKLSSKLRSREVIVLKGGKNA